MSDESKLATPQPSEMELLRAEVRAGFESVAKRFDQVDARLEGHDRRFDAHDKRFDSMNARITDEAEVTRRRFDVAAEDLRQSFKGVIDKTVATGNKVDRLIASNAIEHAAFQEFVTDHEVRITRLEKESGLDPKPGSADRA